MKQTPIIFLLALTFGLASCESDKDKRLQDLKSVGCKLTESYSILLDNPNDEDAGMDLIGLQSEIESGLEEDTGITLEDLEEVMEEDCDNASLLKDAMKY
ncbi:hypothetical protein [Parvicella tangerina]|uniref:Lipoprotein n=1 Tax=Parvicella tangerina TaxID=2829795 RepID=A0A916JR30_9FLAO|nr:hypothetical protein [Parvicella tangerina]CAG5087217.1 hypothetical protein CRYO30217_03419 [Parvicella tangerina]